MGFNSAFKGLTDSNYITPNGKVKVNNELAGVWKETVLASF